MGVKKVNASRSDKTNALRESDQRIEGGGWFVNEKGQHNE